MRHLDNRGVLEDAMPDKHLIIGGAGFIGSHLTDTILRLTKASDICVFDNMTVGDNQSLDALDSARVELTIGDASDPVALLRHIESVRPNKVWHLAANSDISKSAVSSELDVEATFATTAGVCLAISRMSYALDSLTFSSTSAIFGSHPGQIHESSRRNPESSYGWMKLASERLILSLHGTGAVDKVLVARFPNVTGLRQTHGVVKDLVAKYFNLDSPWVVLGDGYQEKPYIHAQCLSETLIRLEAELGVGKFLEINISPNSLINVRRIAQEIEAHAGLGRIPVYGDTPHGWVGDITKYEFDTAALRRMGHLVASSKDAITRSVKEEVQKYLE